LKPNDEVTEQLYDDVINASCDEELNFVTNNKDEIDDGDKTKNVILDSDTLEVGGQGNGGGAEMVPLATGRVNDVYVGGKVAPMKS